MRVYPKQLNTHTWKSSASKSIMKTFQLIHSKDNVEIRPQDYEDGDIKKNEKTSRRMLNSGGAYTHCTLFPFDQVLSHWVFLTRFLMRQNNKSIHRRLHSFSLSYGFVPLGFPS